MSREGRPFDLKPAFIEGSAGRLFVVHYRPADDVDRGTDLILLPPFAEEMNRSRRMTALLGRALAADGWGVLVLDLYGTGDSEGAFEDADWPTWCADVSAAIAWLRRRGDRTVGLLGLRFGALLATAAAAADPGVHRVVLWNPVTSGQTMLTQFLRIRLAATLGEAQGGSADEDTKALRRRLSEGETLDVAGYRLSSGLAAAIDAARLGEPPVPVSARVDWFELVREEGRAPPPTSRRMADAWAASGVSVALRTVVGEPFWSLQEITIAPDLVAATRTVLCEKVA